MTNKILAVFGLIGAAAMLSAALPQARTYTGEIMDSACAAKGSHAAMMKREGTTSARECTLACVKAGAQMVLYNSSEKRSYRLDDQSKASEYAGAKVEIAGTYDAKAKTIHVTDIRPTP